MKLVDALGRKHQCGTIQLDFQLPIRFNLQFRSESASPEAGEEPAAEETAPEFPKLRAGFERPVIIHRAVLGSLERMSAILLEHFKGKLPFWLAPRQIMVIPISEAFSPYAEYLKAQLWNNGFHSEVDTSSATLNKKVRDAQLAGWCYQAVVGAKEEAEWSANLRSRDSSKPLGSFAVDALIEKLRAESMPSSRPLNSVAAWSGRKG